MENISDNNIVNKRSLFKRLAFQIGLPFIIFFIFSVIMLSYSSYSAYKNSYSSAITSPINTLKNLTHSINDETTFIISEGSAISRLAGDVDTNTIRKIADELVSTKPQILKITYFDNNKNPQWESTSISGLILGPSSKLNVISSSIYMEDYLNESLNVHLHKMQYPIFNERYEKMGIIELIYDTTYLWSSLSLLKAKNIYITDMQGNVLLSRSELDSNYKIFNKEIFKKYTSQYNKILTTTSLTGDTIVGVASKIDNMSWVIIVEDSLSENIGMVKVMLIVSSLLLFVLLCLFIIEIILLRRRVFKPLKLLEDSSNKIVEGDYDVWCPPTAGNEFDVISNAMNNTVLSIRSLKQDFDKQIKEKSEGLLDKVKEAEGMGSFMVNRELRMIDLKQENEKLKQQIKKLEDDSNDEA